MAKKATPSCETCHKDTYTEYLCINCHDPEEMEIVHLREEIYEFNNCIECHPSGNENEALHLKEEQSSIETLEIANSESQAGLVLAGSTGEKQKTVMDQAEIRFTKASEKSNIQKNTTNLWGGS